MTAPSVVVGQRFGRWVVLRESHRKPNQLYFLCRCDCGAEKAVERGNLRDGRSTSCGCWNRESASARSTKHGHAGYAYKRRPSSTYQIWSGMLKRCTNQNCAAYPRYGGRGISVCERWRKFENFLADMGERPAGLTLERKDNDRGYEPENCKWATRREQSLNQRPRRKHGKFLVTVNGITAPLSVLAEKHGIRYATAFYRIKRHGWTPQDALTKPTIRTRSYGARSRHL